MHRAEVTDISNIADIADVSDIADIASGYCERILRADIASGYYKYCEYYGYCSIVIGLWLLGW